MTHKETVREKVNTGQYQLLSHVNTDLDKINKHRVWRVKLWHHSKLNVTDKGFIIKDHGGIHKFEFPSNNSMSTCFCFYDNHSDNIVVSDEYAYIMGSSKDDDWEIINVNNFTNRGEPMYKFVYRINIPPIHAYIQKNGRIYVANYCMLCINHKNVIHILYDYDKDYIPLVSDASVDDYRKVMEYNTSIVPNVNNFHRMLYMYDIFLRNNVPGLYYLDRHILNYVEMCFTEEARIFRHPINKPYFPWNEPAQAGIICRMPEQALKIVATQHSTRPIPKEFRNISKKASAREKRKLAGRHSMDLDTVNRYIAAVGKE
jgi:hypothetical protein